MILVAENCKAQEDHKLHTPNIRVLEVSIAPAGSRISVAGVHRSTGSAQVEDGELFLLFSVVAGSVGKRLTLGDSNAPDID